MGFRLFMTPESAWWTKRLNLILRFLLCSIINLKESDLARCGGMSIFRGLLPNLYSGLFCLFALPSFSPLSLQWAKELLGSTRGIAAPRGMAQKGKRRWGRMRRGLWAGWGCLRTPRGVGRAAGGAFKGLCVGRGGSEEQIFLVSLCGGS